jgi:hypothetical protein
MLWVSFFVSIPAGAFGFWLRNHRGLSSVEVSAWIALLSGLLLPRLHESGIFLAGVCTCVSYATMSSCVRVTNQLEMAVVSVLCAVIVYGCRACLVGVGGRLGTFAALAVLVCCGLINVKRRIFHGHSYSQSSGNAP